MQKAISFSGFTIISLLVVILFVTSKTTTQLGVAVLLYPLVIYIAYYLFISKSGHLLKDDPGSQPKSVKIADIGSSDPEGVAGADVSITDIDKRAFLKMIGIAGVSFFLSSVLSKRAESLLTGQAFAPDKLVLEDTEGKKINPAEKQPTDSYVITEIDDDIVAFYGFTNKDGGWYIMKEERDGGSFRYTKGDSDFPGNWERRKDYSYDYYHNVFGK